MDEEARQREIVFAKRRVMQAAGATRGRIGDPGEFLLALVQWAEAHGMVDEAALLREDWEITYGGMYGHP